MAERNFDDGRKRPEGHVFTIEGRTFKTLPTSPVWRILQRKKRDQEGDSQRTIFDDYLDFLRGVIVPEQREAFDSFLEDPDIYVVATDIRDIAEWLLEEMTGSDRPTNGSASSGNGAGPTGKLSRAKRSSRAAASKPSTSPKGSP